MKPEPPTSWRRHAWWTLCWVVAVLERLPELLATLVLGFVSPFITLKVLLLRPSGATLIGWSLLALGGWVVFFSYWRWLDRPRPWLERLLVGGLLAGLVGVVVDSGRRWDVLAAPAPAFRPMSDAWALVVASALVLLAFRVAQHDEPPADGSTG